MVFILWILLFFTGLLWGSDASPGAKWLFTIISIIWLFTVPATIIGGSIGIGLGVVGAIVGYVSRG